MGSMKWSMRRGVTFRAWKLKSLLGELGAGPMWLSVPTCECVVRMWSSCCHQSWLSEIGRWSWGARAVISSRSVEATRRDSARM
eukprot:6536832-Alexandrium_andersonii.AAC.1